MDLARIWGRLSVDDLVKNNKSLLCEDDPRESLRRFHVLRRSYFNFNAIDILILSTDRSKFEIAYGMSRAAEEAATYQTLGFFERLLELSGASQMEYKFTGKVWEGAPATILTLKWSMDATGRKVKGRLFVDYISMLRSRKGVDWSKYLKAEDMILLKEQIDESRWCPMETVERMGLAILKEIAGGDMESLRAWGRQSIDRLCATFKSLICADDPMESIMRFQVLHRSFFNFGSIHIESISVDYVLLDVAYDICKAAEEAAVYQTLGYFERLLELSGAKNIQHKFLSKLWEGDHTTLLELTWN